MISKKNKATTIMGVQTDSNARPWLKKWFAPKIVKKWAECIDDYCVRHEAALYVDIPYDYNERANIGFLSIAAWKAGFLAIEEYSEWKGSKKKGRAGRVDLAIMKNNELVIETKLKHAHPSQIDACAKKTLKKAMEAVKESYKPGRTENKKTQRAAIAFVVMRVFKKSNKKYLSDSIQASIKLAKKVDCDICGWVFPKTVRTADWSDDGADRARYVPGVFLFLRRETR